MTDKGYRTGTMRRLAHQADVHTIIPLVALLRPTMISRTLALSVLVTILLGRLSTITGFVVLMPVRAAGNPLSVKEEDDDVFLDMEAFAKRSQELVNEPPQEFDGYALRDLLLAKWGECYDVDFNRVDSFGFREIYLNIYPFKLGGKRWRHETELDYLMHLQAVVEILQKYSQLDNVVYQIMETEKTPKMGAPIKAVPIRLNLTKDEVNTIMGY
jgi:hypothetical protein